MLEPPEPPPRLLVPVLGDSCPPPMGLPWLDPPLLGLKVPGGMPMLGWLNWRLVSRAGPSASRLRPTAGPDVPGLPP